MASLLARFRSVLPYSYRNLSQSSLHGSDLSETDKIDENAASSKEVISISRCHAICLYILSLVLAIALTLTLLREASNVGESKFGSYEKGFGTEIQPDRNTLALKKVKFYGGIVYDEDGNASLTSPPADIPDYFGLPGDETDHFWTQDLKDRFIAIDPEDWPPEAVEFLDQDLVHGTIRSETNGLHSLHCLNYIRKSLSPEYYVYHLKGTDLNITEPQPLPLHLKHCLIQIHQLIKCQLDMTPIPRTVRHSKHIFHADTDQWHICRDFSAMRTWMFPSAEHHT